MHWLRALPEARQRGSFPRCLLMMEGVRATVSRRLTSLVNIPGIQIREDDQWLPRGLPFSGEGVHWNFSRIREARLGETPELLDQSRRQNLTDWWLAVPRRANTPNWDIASTCLINGVPGLLLVEAKAYDRELSASGKPAAQTFNGRKNHDKIAAALQQAETGLNAVMPGWSLSLNRNYQLANRFAWAWRIAVTDMPVVLVYLGFLNAAEMNDRGRPFVDPDNWELAVRNHSNGTIPSQAWNSRLSIGVASLQPLIRSVEVGLSS